MMRAGALAADAAMVAEVKAYLRLETDGEDALVARLGLAALAHGEAFTGLVLVARTVAETLPAGPGWRRLAGTPVAAVATVEGLGPMGVLAALPAGGWAADIDASGDGWVRLLAPSAATRLQATYTAGLATGWAALPDAIRQGAVRLAAHLFTHRDAAGEGAPPAAVAALWRPWRRIRL